MNYSKGSLFASSKSGSIRRKSVKMSSLMIKTSTTSVKDQDGSLISCYLSNKSRKDVEFHPFRPLLLPQLNSKPSLASKAQTPKHTQPVL